ncbi:MAG: hypothetical protein AAF513_09725 [Pseudomonadota bacterium]
MTFVATLLLTFAFPPLAQMWQLTLVDALSDPAVVREAIASLSAEQKTAHAWITATVDVAYPLAYGALFIGSALCFFPRAGQILAWVFVVLIGIDLLEGVVQVLALTDTADLIDTKAVLTPLKFILFLVGLIVTVAGWGRWLVKRLASRAAAD